MADALLPTVNVYSLDDVATIATQGGPRRIVLKQADSLTHARMMLTQLRMMGILRDEDEEEDVHADDDDDVVPTEHPNLSLQRLDLGDHERGGTHVFSDADDADVVPAEHRNLSLQRLDLGGHHERGGTNVFPDADDDEDSASVGDHLAAGGFAEWVAKYHHDHKQFVEGVFFDRSSDRESDDAPYSYVFADDVFHAAAGGAAGAGGSAGCVFLADGGAAGAGGSAGCVLLAPNPFPERVVGDHEGGGSYYGDLFPAEKGSAGVGDGVRVGAPCSFGTPSRSTSFPAEEGSARLDDDDADGWAAWFAEQQKQPNPFADRVYFDPGNHQRGGTHHDCRVADGWAIQNSYAFFRAVDLAMILDEVVADTIPRLSRNATDFDALHRLLTLSRAIRTVGKELPRLMGQPPVTLGNHLNKVAVKALRRQTCGGAEWIDNLLTRVLAVKLQERVKFDYN